MSRLSVQKFFTHSAEKLRRGNLYCFVSLISGIENVKDKRTGGGASRFSAETFLSHSAEYFVGQPFCAVFQKFPSSEKVYG